jgi:hypothetical protein
MRSSKSQIPNSKEAPMAKLQADASACIGVWSLELLWDLELGAWDFLT